MCSTCPKYKSCVKVCKEMKDYLRKQGIYSSNWIRPRVSPKKDKKENKGRWREIPASHRIYEQFRGMHI